MANRVDAAIIGAGAAGLAAAVRLARAGVDVLALEARDRAELQLAIGYQWSFSPTIQNLKRDIAAGREPELDAIPGAVLRAAARHGLACPTIERLVSVIAERVGVG